MLIILDNAESPKIIAAVGELCQFKKDPYITSRIPAVPQCRKGSAIPTPPVQTARDIIYGIRGHGERSEIIDDILQRLDTLRRCMGLITTRTQRQP